MFPNVRLLIGALFITILVLSCEFGVFAALRVSREPLSRLTSESAPLQLVPGKNAPPAVPVAWTALWEGPRESGDALNRLRQRYFVGKRDIPRQGGDVAVAALPFHPSDQVQKLGLVLEDH